MMKYNKGQKRPRLVVQTLIKTERIRIEHRRNLRQVLSI